MTTARASRAWPPSVRALAAYLDYYRATVELKCRVLTDEQVRTRSVAPSAISLHGLVRHLSGVEAWFHGYDGRPDHQFFRNYVPGASDGFTGVSADRADDDLASFLASVERSRRTVRDRALDEVVPGGHDTLRWIYLHMIEEYARHNGHADILRERIDGATGEWPGRGGRGENARECRGPCDRLSPHRDERRDQRMRERSIRP